ncbi:hypothetical protein CYMTET_53813 [Cymbomonas tetramitiformis]|uniref:TRP C-terminal domain-containing protein n=1 Tax=Cymbomonas tetramitiformis TaxID=36881 RepID=A0AAE0BHD8_9CHLO|nr:hypothetical protein CYMTET_53813 [Cymbomonas tetramitiformis]
MGRGGGFHWKYGEQCSTCTDPEFDQATGGAVIIEYGFMEVRSSTFSKNQAQGGGGAIAVMMKSSLFLHQDVLFEQNTAGSTGGALYCAMSSMVRFFTLSVLLANSASQGGAVDVTTNSSVHFEAGGWLYGNKAVQQGGAVCLADSAVLSMVGVSVDSNTVDLFAGGGISAGNSNQVLIDQSLVVNNTVIMGSGGGIYGVGATIVVRGNSRIADNEAKVEGGGVCVVGNGTLEVDASSVTGNRAAGNGGGIAVSTGSEAALRNGTVLERNSGGDGGGLAVSEGRMNIVDSAICMNTADGSAPGVLLDGGAEVAVEGSRFELHPGSALKVVGEAQATVRSTTFAENNSTSGGGLWAASGTTVMLDGCNFEYNVAEAGSGGAFYSAGNLTLIASLCVGNTAQQGGSAFLHFTLPGQAVEMRDSQFCNNTALGEGAVFYLYESLTESRPAAAAQLAELQYERNFAQGGGSVIFWDPMNLTVSPQPPACLNCTEDVAAAGNSAGYDSPSGWASRSTGLRVAETQAEEAGGYDLAHGIEVKVIDANGEVVTNADMTLKLLNSAGSPCTFTGDGFQQQVVNGSAVFRHDLQLVGAPGDTCLLHVTTELGVEGEVSSSHTAVPLRYCMPGEYPVDGYSSGSQKCVPCAANHISFSNDTACMKCTEGITCPGGDAYVVCPGHWLAPNARHCHRHEDPTQCFLDRLYECGVKDACRSVEREDDAVAGDDRADDHECALGGRNNARMGSGIASVAGLALCDSDAYYEGVMCGGMTQVICAADHYPSALKDRCHQCPSRGAILSQVVLVTAALGAVGVLILTLCLRVSRTKPMRELQKDIVEDLRSGGANATSNQLVDARNALNLVVGYAQVMGQLTNIYDTEIVPPFIRQFVVPFSLVNLDLDMMLNMRCFSHYFAPFLGSSSFWFAFWQSVVTPTLLCALFAMVYLYLARLCALQQRLAAGEAPSDMQAKELQAIELQWHREMKAACAGAAIFLCVFVHPGISTLMLQLFNCESVDFDAEDLHTQMWLRADSASECETTQWWWAVAAATFTMATYVFGFPILLFVSMWRLRCYQKVRMPRQVADRHVELVQQGVWIPCSENDVVAVQLSGSFHALKLDDLRPQYFSWYGVLNMLLAKKGSPRGEEAVTPSPVPKSGILVEAETEEKAEGLEGGGRITKETLTRLTRRWRVKAYMQTAPPVDLYLPRHAFVECGGVDEASCAAAREALEARRSASLWKRPAPVALADCAGNEEGGEEGSKEGSVIMTRDGRLIKGVHCYEKNDVGDMGAITMVPVTMLDDPAYSKALGQFWDPFEDACYYWQTVEIIRRLLQTGIVVLVGMIAGENAALVFAVLVSVFALLLHQRYSPFKNDSMDDLALCILLNQFIVQMMLVAFKLSDGASGFEVGLVIFLLQIVLLTYAMTLIVPAFRPTFVELKHTSIMRILKKLGQNYSANSIQYNEATQQENETRNFDRNISNPTFSDQCQRQSQVQPGFDGRIQEISWAPSMPIHDGANLSQAPSLCVSFGS